MSGILLCYACEMKLLFADASVDERLLMNAGLL